MPHDTSATDTSATDTSTAGTTTPALFQPLTLRGQTLHSRIAVSPMCMYAATDGFATDFHLVHLGRFALGGAALVTVEATAVTPAGRISHHDLGIWSDEHVPGLARIAAFLTEHGAVPGIQLAHAGRRASVREPWHAGHPLTEQDAAEGLAPWVCEAPSALPAGPDWPVPTEMTQADIDRSLAEWGAAARRAVKAGFGLIEVHGAHGYLAHEFLSPISNHRTDGYGGSLENRMRYPLEVVRAIREAIPDHIALSYRLSAIDGIDGGLDLEDTLVFATRLEAAGVNLIDTSSGGITTDRTTDTRVRRGFSFHADFSRAVRGVVTIPVATVGLVVDPTQANLLVEHGDCDVVLLGRPMLDDPNWAHHAQGALGGPAHEHWPIRYGSALGPWERVISRLHDAGETPLDRFA